MIEETYEVLEALDSGDKGRFCNELGDLLLQIVFHAQIAKENGDFDIGDVTTEVCKKLITRHPHIFGDVKADTPEKVIENWEAIKKKEKNIKSQTGVLRDVPKNLPALMRSYKAQKAAQVGFDWDNIEDVFRKVEEEIQELQDVYKSNNVERITDELGDAFCSRKPARFLNVQPELALNGRSQIHKEVQYIQQQSVRQAKSWRHDLPEMDELWNEAKSALGQSENLTTISGGRLMNKSELISRMAERQYNQDRRRRA